MGVRPGGGGGGGGDDSTTVNLTPGTGTFTATDGAIVGGMWDGWDLYDPGGNFTNLVEGSGESVLNTAVPGGYFRPGVENGQRFDDNGLCLSKTAVGDWSMTLKGRKALGDTHVYWGPGAFWARGNDSAFALTCVDGGTDRVWGRAVVGVEQIGKTTGSTVVDPQVDWYYRCRRVGKDIIYEESSDGSSWTVIRTAEDDVLGSVCKVGLIHGNYVSHVGIVTIDEGVLIYTPPP